MAFPVVVPELGSSVKECILISWKKQKGEAVKKGEVIAEIETDKSISEIESPGDGLILETFFQRDDIVPVMESIAVIGQPGEETEKFKPASERGAIEREEENPADVESEKQQIPTTRPKSAASREEKLMKDKVAISPRARWFVERHGMDISDIERRVRGTGPRGRVVERDVEDFFHTAPRVSDLDKRRLDPEKRRVSEPGRKTGGTLLTKDLIEPGAKLKGTRAVIARKMRDSLMHTAQYTVGMSADVTGLLALRKRIKERVKENRSADINLNHMIIYATLNTLKEFPDFNALLIDGLLYKHKQINLGFACDTPRGLVVPVMKGCQDLDLFQIAEEVKRLTSLTTQGNISPDDLTDGTFTVTNLGSTGVEFFTPILNPPQVAVLGVCAPELRCTRTSDRIVFADHMRLCLTVDHQLIDGAPAARFLNHLKDTIENFTQILNIEL